MTRLSRFAIGVIACAIAAALSPGAAFAAFPGGNGLIAFTGLSGSPRPPSVSEWRAVFTVRPDGSGLRQLTDGGGDLGPSWSPDGRRLVFTRCCDGLRYVVFTIDADGGDLTRVFDVETSVAPTFSPSGRRILYTTSDPACSPTSPPLCWSIRTIGADGTEPREVGKAPSWGDPQYSPDGARIIGGGSYIWSMRRDGSHRRALTDPAAVGEDFTDVAPDYSPDGRFITFLRCGYRTCDELRVMRADGSDERSVPGAGDAGDAAWAPAGDRIVLPLTAGSFPWSCSDLYTIAPTGADRQRLTTGCDENTHAGQTVGSPSWQPDPPGTFIVTDVDKNKRRGTAKLRLDVPGPGELELARTRKVKAASKRAAAEGDVTLPVKPRGKAKERLRIEGRATVRAELTYSPDGAGPNTISKRIGLRKRG